MRLSYQLIEDAAQYEDFPDFRQPALIFHGAHGRRRAGGVFRGVRGGTCRMSRSRWWTRGMTC